MKYILKPLLLIAVLGCFSHVQADDTLVGEYHACLSARDHYNSSDEKLTSVAAIIRQDRANYHKYKARDENDESDEFFGSAANREKAGEHDPYVRFQQR
jgi:DnaJ-domain-containing protein 1